MAQPNGLIMQIEILTEFLTSQDPTSEFIVRFWSKVNKTQTCWLWTDHTRDGYGSIHCRVSGRDLLLYAHRVSWIIHFGLIPKGRFVLHNCPGGDRRTCINPCHLWIGTRVDNARDMVLKGRHPSVGTVVSDKEVCEIREKANQQLYRKIAQEYGISRAGVMNIVNFKRRKGAGSFST